jgi:hypothetical protein
MPGYGVPKPASQRRRRNAAPEVTRITPGTKADAPEMPGDYGPRGERWWRNVWAHPIAAIWETCDHPAVERLGYLIDKGPEASASEMGEARQLEDRLGLSPMARRRLQYEIDKAAGATASAPAAPAKDDRFLRVVS